MLNKNAFYITTAVAALSSSTAFADVTANDVWLNIQESLGMFADATVQIGDESSSGDTITVTDLTWVSTQADTTTTSTIPSLTIAQQGNGTALVTMPQPMQIEAVSANGTTNAITTSTFLISNDGLEVVASGAPEAMRYDVSAAQLKAAVDSIVEGTSPVPVVGSVAFNGLSGSYFMEDGDIRIVSSEMTADSTDIEIDLSAMEDSGGFKMTGQIADLATQGQMSGPASLNFSDPENDDFSDLTVEGGYTFGAMTYDIATNERGSAFDATATADSGSLNVEIENGAMIYETATEGLAITASAPGFPLPIDVTLDAASSSLAMPLAATGEAAPIKLGFALEALTVNDELWAMADPSGQLPREPITLQLAISGLAKMLADFDDPAFDDMEMPFEPLEVSIDQLNIDAVGVQIGGEGSFTFDAGDTTTFPGFPRPEGSASLSASGVNALMDSLVNMGLLPQDQVMGARMMMGMFATSTGDDELSSTVEVNGQGHLLINGQRMR